MHGNMNLKFSSAKQAKEVYEYKNIKQKLHKTTAAIWFNKTCREKKVQSKRLLMMGTRVPETCRAE
jgi:hypothetical protein